MSTVEPTVDLDARFSSPGATPTEWSQARAGLESAEIFWLSTVRPSGRPHVTPLIAVWRDGALYFCTGPEERKAKNLAENPHCILTTGCNTSADGLDIVVEGEAANVRDNAKLRRIAEAYEAKYGSAWHFDVRDGVFINTDGGEAFVYEVRPATVFGFERGESYSQTRWRFPPASMTGIISAAGEPQGE